MLAPRPAAVSRLRSRSGAGVRTHCGGGARRELLERGVRDQAAFLDDGDVVHCLRDLGEHVARDEDRAPLRAQ